MKKHKPEASTEAAAQINREGWSHHAYEAWVRGMGTPELAAQQLKENPNKKLAPFRTHLGEVNGKRIANLLGSNGKAAVSLALLGADVTVVDLSPENAKFAMDLAREAGVNINYIVSDVMHIPPEHQITGCDIVLMELGILHWIMDLPRFFRIVYDMLKDGGRVILRDFHPLMRSLLRWENGVMAATRDYFDETVHEGVAPFAIFLTDEERNSLAKTITRGWTMGQIITAIAEAGLVVRVLHEESGPIQRWIFPAESPEGIENRIPGLFTLVADRA